MAREVGPTQIGLLSAGIAFYALLSVFPAIAAVVALAGLFIPPEAVASQLEALSNVVPEDAARILIGEATKVASAEADGLSLTFALGVAFSIYLSTRATKALIHGLNEARGEKETRGFLGYWVTVVGLTVTLVFGVALMFVLLVVTPTVLTFVPDEIIPGSTADLVRAGRWVLVAGVVLLGLSVIYRFGPAKRPVWRWLSAGSILAAACWLAGSYGFSHYVRYFADYNASFGSLGGVIILLTWLWLSAYVVLLGALLDQSMARTTSTAQSDASAS